MNGAETNSRPSIPDEAASHTEPPLVSVVIVNWNTSRELEDCLGSLYQYHPDLALEVWVVDNASSDESLAMLKENFPGVKLIENHENHGFAAANNQAFAKIDPRSPLVLVLNPDIVFLEGSINILLDFLKSRQDAHVVTPRMLGSGGRLQAGCRRREPTPGSMLARLLGLGCLFPASRALAGYTYGDLSESITHEIDSASGSFMFFKREVLEGVGGFDERFFLYAEDLDWCRRARQKGFGIYYHPETGVVHLRGASSGKSALKSLWHLHRTAFLYIKKHHRSDYSLAFRMILAVALALHFVFAAGIRLVRAPFYRRRKVKVKT